MMYKQEFFNLYAVLIDFFAIYTANDVWLITYIGLYLCATMCVVGTILKCRARKSQLIRELAE